MLACFASFGFMHRIKWSSQCSMSSKFLPVLWPSPISRRGSASSSISPSIYYENLLQIDHNRVAPPQLGELPSSSSSSVFIVSSGTLYIKMLAICYWQPSYIKFSNEAEISSTFFSIKFLILYSTSFAEWLIVNL